MVEKVCYILFKRRCKKCASFVERNVCELCGSVDIF